MPTTSAAPVASPPSAPPVTFRARRLLGLLPVGLILAVSAGACAPAIPKPATPVFAASAGIEGLPGYEPSAKPCDPEDTAAKAGPIALRGLLNATYGPVDAGITRSCDGSVSEHHDGRALDWMADYANPTLRPKALAVIDWLRATDAAGNTNAVARRLGLMYWIYNHQMYGSWNNYNPTPYSCAGDATSCHVNHIHFSFTWAGAYKQTSFWRGSPLPTATTAGAGFRVDSHNPAPALAPVTLASGRTYVIEASGTYKFGTGAGQSADAECSITSGTTWKTVPTSTPMYGSETLDLKVIGGSAGGSAWTPVTDTGGGCNTADHRYRMTVRSWSPVVLSGVVLDSRSNNSGTLTVKLVSVS